MIYYYSVDFEKNKEKITAQLDENEQLFCPNYEKEIKYSDKCFYSFCDLLSIDINLLIDEFIKIYDRNYIMVKEFNKLSFLLFDHTFNTELYETYKNAQGFDFNDKDEARIFLLFEFDWIEFLKAYAINLINDKSLYDFNVFKKYITTLIDSKLATIEYDGMNYNGYYCYLNQGEKVTDYGAIISLFKEGIKSSNFKQFTYVAYNLKSFCSTCLQLIIENGLVVKKCKNCGKYFVPINRSDTIYCERPSPQDGNLTCREYGKKRLWYEKDKNDKALKLYRNIYSKKQMSVIRNPDIKEYADDFNDYKKIGQAIKDAYKAMKISYEDFYNWLEFVNSKGINKWQQGDDSNG